MNPLLSLLRDAAELERALIEHGEMPCAACGSPLGSYWRERYNSATGRLEKVHRDCNVQDRAIELARQEAGR